MGQLDAAKDLVLKISRQMAAKGYLTGTGGNVSVRIAGQRAMAITPSGQDYTQMSRDDVCILDWNLKPIEGTLKPSIESGLHAAVYQARTDVGVVLHTHQLCASACALVNKPIPALFDEQVRFLGRSVPIVPYAPSGTSWLKRKIMSKLKNRANAYLLQNHGAICLGPTAERAMLNVELLEKCAAAFLLAYYTDQRLTRIPLVIREIIVHKLRQDQKQAAAVLDAPQRSG